MDNHQVNVENPYQPTKTSNQLELSTYLNTTEQPYPKLKVIALFSILGSILGAVMMTLGFFLFVGLTGNGISSFEVEYILIGLGISLVFACIPASLTGVIVAMIQLVIQDVYDYIKLLIIGGLVSLFLEFILLNIVLGIGNNNASIEMHELYIPSIFVGAISATITGFFVLPKRD